MMNNVKTEDPFILGIILIIVIAGSLIFVPFFSHKGVRE